MYVYFFHNAFFKWPGYAYGMCESKDLEANGKYILFLNNKLPEYDYYTQSNVAEPETELTNLRNICGLELSFPGRYQLSFKFRPYYPRFAHYDIYVYAFDVARPFTLYIILFSIHNVNTKVYLGSLFTVLMNVNAYRKNSFF